MLLALPFVRRARGFARRRLWAEAAAAYRKALWLAPRSDTIWMQYGHALRWTDRHDLAAGAYGRAVALAPQAADHRLHHGMALGATERWEEARAEFTEVLRLEPDHPTVKREMVRFTPRTANAERLDYIMIGTTGLCNASCIHCPTGKDSTLHVPRVPMKMELFRSIIDQLHDLDVPILGQIAFGLFGDALVDPFVVERARYVRSKFPHLPISINSNAAAFNPKKHGGLKELDVVMGLHTESLDPQVFDDLMRPLRADRVFVKYEQMMAMFGEAVQVNFPLSRRNAGEIATSRRWFEERGARILVTPLMNRCAEDDSVFQGLAYAPVPMGCTSQVLESLAIDCDGLVLACCQDFERREPIGDLTRQTLREVLDGQARRRFGQMLDDRQHGCISTCRGCKTDRPVELTAEAA